MRSTGDQASGWSPFFLASRLRATSAAAAPPNNRSIGGAGTGAGPPEELPPWLLDPPRLLEPWPFELQPLLPQPLLLLQPLEPWLDEPLLLEP
jgi:hypothetical protein